MNSPLLEKSMDFATQIVLFYEEFSKKCIGFSYARGAVFIFGEFKSRKCSISFSRNYASQG